MTYQTSTQWGASQKPPVTRQLAWRLYKQGRLPGAKMEIHAGKPRLAIPKGTKRTNRKGE